MNETSQETWNATHAQLLKSVADAQAKLLAGINEISDKLTVQAKEILSISGQLDVIGAVLAEFSSAAGESLRVHRPMARPVKRAKRRR